MINTITDEVSISAEKLAYPVSSSSVIVIGDVLYCFGGYTVNGTILDTWMKLDMLSIEYGFFYMFLYTYL